MSTTATETVKIDPLTVKLWVRDGQPDEWTYEDVGIAVERVNRGALLLDEENPSWMEKVVPDNLQMSSARWCIVGQVYGDYDDGVGIPFGMQVIGEELNQDNRDEVTEKAIEHGFMDNGVPFDLLDRVWVYLLTARAHHTKRVILEMP